MRLQTRSGVALLMTLGILALLAILAAAFATFTRLSERTTRDFNYEKQAREIAEAGIQHAIAELKEDARKNFVFNGLGPFKDTFTDMSGNVDGMYKVSIVDTASMVNINTASKELLECIPDIGSAKALAIINRRDNMQNKMFLTKQSICLTSRDEDGEDVGKDLFNKIKDLITAHGYIDPNVLDEGGNRVQPGRSAININTFIKKADSTNTADKEYRLLKAMLEKIEGVGPDTADAIIAALKNNPNKRIDSWAEFNEIIKGVTTSGFTATEKQNVKDMFNPNRKKPHGTNSAGTKGITTEFCFHSGGIYEITSTGTLTNKAGEVVATTNKAGEVVAKKTINAIVKIFDLWNQTLSTQFSVIQTDSVNTTTNDKRVSWEDNCPVMSNDNWNGTPTIDPTYGTLDKSNSYYKIPNSIKMGYWEEFSRTNVTDIAPWSSDSSFQTTFNGKANMPQRGKIILGKDDPQWWWWNFSDCSATVYKQEGNIPPNDGAAEHTHWVGTFYFRISDGGKDTMAYTWHVDESTGEKKVKFSYDVSGDKKEFDDTGLTSYPKDSCYRVIQKGNNIDFYVFNSSDISKAPDYSKSIDNITRRSSGKFGFWTETDGGTLWDNFRLIPDTCWYMSPWISNVIPNPFIKTGYKVEWANLWATVTVPEPDATFNQSVDFQTVTEFWVNIPGAGEVDTVRNADGSYKIKSANGEDLQYKAIFKTEDTNFLKAPVLEDVWITYLPKTKILYWREGTEE